MSDPDKSQIKAGDSAKFSNEFPKSLAIQEMQEELDKAVAATAEQYHARVLSLEMQLSEPKKASAQSEAARKAQPEKLAAA